MSADSANLKDLEKRVWPLFQGRFMRRAESPGAEQQIDEQLAAKVAKIERHGQRLGELRQTVANATELWAQRSQLRKRDVLYLAAALLYFISPIDAVPDVLPVLGYADDLILLSAIVGIILRGLSSVGTQSKEKLEHWIDERAERVFERFDESATGGVQKTVSAVVIGLWGTTTAAAVSLAVAAALGRYPTEFLIYVVMSTALVMTCNIITGLHYWRAYRNLDGTWRARLHSLFSARLTPAHFIAMGLPIVTLIALGIGRACL